MLAKLITVDGSGSALDADLLDGQNGTWYLDRVNHNGVQAQSTVTNLVSDLALKAPLASPALTGNPTAPTPTAGDADTSIATTAFVSTAVSSIVVPPGTVISDTAPGSPAHGQLWWDSDLGVLFLYYVDPGGGAGQWVQVGGTSAAGQMVQTVVTASGTYTKPAGLRYLEVEGVGGGGAGGGNVATAAGQGSAGAGGSSGGWCSKLIPASSLPATVAMTIGAGGTPVSGGSGGSGAATIFAGFWQANGGTGGTSGIAFAGPLFTATGAGGGASGGDVNIAGNTGQPGFIFPAAPGALGGNGGASYYGSAPQGQSNSNGVAGFYGAGGSGSARIASGPAAPGGAGGGGMIILKEYF